jgi:carbamate kinase
LFPAFDLSFVPFQSAPFRFLRSSAQAVHQAANMVRVIANSELTLDHLGNAGRGPQIGSVSLRHRPLEQQAAQTLSLASFKGRPGEKRT